MTPNFDIPVRAIASKPGELVASRVSAAKDPAIVYVGELVQKLSASQRGFGDNLVELHGARVPAAPAQKTEAAITRLAEAGAQRPAKAPSTAPGNQYNNQ